MEPLVHRDGPVRRGSELTSARCATQLGFEAGARSARVGATRLAPRSLGRHGGAKLNPKVAGLRSIDSGAISIVALSSSYATIFDDTVRACAQARIRGSGQRQVTAFWPVVGSAFQSGHSVMVVGQAVNGWGDWSLDLSADPSEASIVDLRKRAQRFAESSKPLRWLSDNPQDWDNDYNPHRSQFWAVTRRLIEAGIHHGLWYENLAWSNLYKVAPSEGGNPGVALRRAQLSGAAELLRMELISFAPKYVVFLTGWEWAKDVIPDSAVRERHLTSRVVEALGRWCDVPFVVTPHPRSRVVAEIAGEVLRAAGSA